MIAVELPELAVDDVKVFVAKERHDLVNVLLLLEQLQHLQKVRSPQLRCRDLSRPAPVHAVKDACNDGVHVTRVEFGGLLQERQSRMRVHHVLH